MHVKKIKTTTTKNPDICCNKYVKIHNLFIGENKNNKIASMQAAMVCETLMLTKQLKTEHVNSGNLHHALSLVYAGIICSPCWKAAYFVFK